MRAAGLWLLAAVGLALAGCGQRHASDAPAAAASASPAASAALAPGSAPGREPGIDQAAIEAAKLVRTSEEGAEKGDDSTGDNGAHNPLLAAVASTIGAASATAMAATPAASQWQEGVNYTRIVPAQPTSAPAGQIEVLEFFWYGCPHCYALDPLVESWRKTKPAYVTFTRVPVMWADVHRATARLFYALQSLGKLDQLNGEIFKEIHATGDPLVASDPSNVAANEHVQEVFLRRFGITDDAFDKAYHSFDVEAALQRADELGQRYRVDGVPTFVVNGKYVADVASAKGPDRLLLLVDDLAAQEHKR